MMRHEQREREQNNRVEMYVPNVPDIQSAPPHAEFQSWPNVPNIPNVQEVEEDRRTENGELIIEF